MYHKTTTRKGIATRCLDKACVHRKLYCPRAFFFRFNKLFSPDSPPPSRASVYHSWRRSLVAYDLAFHPLVFESSATPFGSTISCVKLTCRSLLLLSLPLFFMSSRRLSHRPLKNHMFPTRQFFQSYWNPR